MKTLVLLLLSVVNLIHCQDIEQMIVFTLQGVLEKLEGVSDKLKGYEAIEQKQDEIMNKLMDVQQKLGNMEANFQDVQRKLDNLESNFQDFHHELEHMKGGYHEIKSFVRKGISGVISLAEKDECLEGSHPCGLLGTCQNTLFSFTCSCPSGFTWEGSDCTDIDECIQGKAGCSTDASCTNTLGSYSCSCNPPFQGDGLKCQSCLPGYAFNGHICEEFQCRSPAKVLLGLGCINYIREPKTFREMEEFCQEEGGRLMQKFHGHHLTDIKNNFAFNVFELIIITGWVGVYEEKWTSDLSLIPEDLCVSGDRSDPSRRCGILTSGSSPSSVKVTQTDCSQKRPGYCQFQLP
ncbi:uncharacterized protein [Palaemon carinicauda]|uniref:uncharacterized protein isoform X3 n=1 Tax=Palaemon carinicauda TaxID=392227 RepID=UPI0035B6626B